MMSKLMDQICPKCEFKESGFSSGESYWSAQSLYDQAEKEGARAYVFPLKHFDFSVSVWGQTERLTDLAYHFRRVLESDLSIPIIVGPLGNVLDGYHRIIKAVVTGEKVMAYRLIEMSEENVDPEGDSADA